MTTETKPAVVVPSGPNGGDGVSGAGPDFINENRIDGVGGPPSLAALAADGLSVLTF